MPIKIKDFFRSYTKLGENFSSFEIAREDPTDGAEFYAYKNEEGSYIFQRVTTSGTLRIYEYFGSNKSGSFASDFTNRASLTYVEYNALFVQSL